MNTVIQTIPFVLVLIVMINQLWRIRNEGLFMALLYLAWSVAAAVVGYALTKLLIDPAKVDLFGLGALLVENVPAGIFKEMPHLEDFARALPTALVAVIIYPAIFDLLRLIGFAVLRKLNKKQKWSEQYLHFKGQKAVAAVVAVFTASVCLMVDMSILTGTLTFSGNMLSCAQALTKDERMAVAADVVHELDVSPVIKLARDLGTQKLFYGLTTVSRDGEETFSVGKDMDDMSRAFVGLLPVIQVLSHEGKAPTGEELRELPQKMEESPESVEMMVDVVHGLHDELKDNGSVDAASQIVGASPEAVDQYVDSLEADTAQQDMTTVCNIAAILSDRGLLPEAGESFDTSCLNDPQLQAEIMAELQKNPSMMAKLGLAP